MVVAFSLIATGLRFLWNLRFEGCALALLSRDLLCETLVVPQVVLDELVHLPESIVVLVHIGFCQC